MAGLGLSEFLSGSSDDGKRSGGGGLWHQSWKDKGSVVVWLHTLAKVYTVWGHSFIVEDEIDDRDESGEKTGKSKRVLRFPRFISPDPIEVCAQQFFREDATGLLRLMPQHDPFLLLREWLRMQGRTSALPLDTVVFEWTDHKNKGALIQWELGVISGLVKRGQSNWNHSLDAKYEGLFTVVLNDDLAKGAKLTRESKLLTDKIREEIKKQVDSRGEEEGDPLKNPYALKLVYDKNARSPANTYNAYRFDKAPYTDEVYAAIASEEYPDAEPFATPQPGDSDKIRAAFEAAAQIELPISAIFSDDPAERASLLMPSRAPKAAPKPAAAPRPPAQPAVAKPGGARPPSNGAKPPAAKPAQASAPEPANDEPPKAIGRRRKVDKPAPPPEPERIPCEGELKGGKVCGNLMLPTESKCSKCGAEYEVDGQEAAPVSATPQSGQSASAPDACWACGSKDLTRDDDGSLRCADCGVDQTDKLPF